MGPPTLSFLLTRKGPQPRLSRQVPRRSETAARSQPTLLRWSRCRSRRSAAVRQTHAPPAPSRLGRLCQASLRWSPAGIALSRPLHPSRGHLQSSLVGLRAGACHLPLEGLRPRWQARQDDSCGHRVLTALLSARAPQRIRAHPSLRIPRQSLSRFPPGTIPTTAVQPSLIQSPLHTRRDWNLQRCGGEFFSLALPTLRRDDDRGSEMYRCRIIHMLLLRFFVGRPPLAAQGCAPARRPTRVPAASPPSLRPLSAYALAHLQHHSDNPSGVSTTLRCSPQAPFRSTLPFKSHSAPHPPQ